MIKKTKKEAKYIISQFSNVLSVALKNIINPPSKLPNEVNHIEGGFISYNPKTDVDKETALCFDSQYFILLGDFRKDVSKCKNIKECIKIFKKLIKKGKKVSP